MHTLTGTGDLTTDRFGMADSAFGFANNLSYAAFGHSLANKSFSIGGWLFQEEHSPITAGGFAQGNIGEAGKAFRLMTDYYDASVLFAFWYDDFNIYFDRDRSQWLHLFGTFDNTTLERRIYINGQLFASQGSAYGFSGTGDLWFGFMEGTMDEIRVYDRAISSEEVGLIYTNESVSVSDNSSTIFLLAPLAVVLFFRRSHNKNAISSRLTDGAGAAGRRMNDEVMRFSLYGEVALARGQAEVDMGWSGGR